MQETVVYLFDDTAWLLVWLIGELYVPLFAARGRFSQASFKRYSFSQANRRIAIPCLYSRLYELP